MQAKIAVLPGDGIGADVIAEALKVLRAVAQVWGHDFLFEEALIGGIAIDQTGDPLPQETLDLCRASDAVLLGAVGGPKWDDPKAKVRPEQGLLGLRKGLGLFANLRPVKLIPALLNTSNIKPEALRGTDLLVVRELTGGIYFGERGRRDGGKTAYDTMIYTEAEVERVVRLAFELARKRRKQVTSVDKANVLESSRLWRETATRVAQDYPDVEFNVLLVDACAMYLIRRPTSFDVLVMGNMFGDILTDEASMLAGSMGMLPSASLAEGTFGMYEPIHGSAPSHAGKDDANPIATILSAAMLLHYSLGLEEEARAIEAAVEQVLSQGLRTYDIAEPGSQVIGTRAMGDAIVQALVAGR
ncbi:MAG: 3-isopropylmalate dehydrogenase [Chloroflexi bacterium]|nr:3-isopropylmalate dehydrogenase [Chloroflexota bacterium]